MANILVIIDTDPCRRYSCKKVSGEAIAPVTGLERGGLDCGACSIVWAHGPSAPVSHHQHHQAAALLLGDALEADGTRMNAQTLLQRWLDCGAGIPASFDGYFAAFVYSQTQGLFVGGDVLGLFPLYYFERDGVVLVGSSAT
ncbi:MAG: hypothetical protein JJ992_13060, partial [Planctomycetes bacterium]|nr:hypothetical protein [Planctomycetota bacterium]